MITLLPRESRDRFDLDDNVCWALISHRKSQSIQTGEEVVEKLVGGKLDVLMDNPEFCNTMAAIDTDLKIIAARFDTQGCLERPT